MSLARPLRVDHTRIVPVQQAVQAATVGAEPDGAVPALGDGPDAQVAQPFPGAENLELARAEAHQAAADGADPEIPFAVLQDRAGQVDRQPVARIVKNIAVVLEAAEAAAERADPQAALMVVDQGAHGIVAQAVPLPQAGEGPAVEPVQAAVVGAHPQGAAPVLMDDPHPAPEQVLFPGVTAHLPLAQREKEIARRPDPQRAVAGRAQGPDRVFRLAAGENLGNEAAFCVAGAGAAAVGEEAGTGADPQRAVAVRSQRRNVARVGPGRRRDLAEGAVPVAAEPLGAADPQAALRVESEREDEVAGEPVGRRVIAEAVVAPAEQAVGRAGPQRPVGPLGHDQHAVVLDLGGIGLVENGELPAVEAAQPLVGADPDVVVPRLDQAQDRVLRQAAVVGVPDIDDVLPDLLLWVQRPGDTRRRRKKQRRPARTSAQGEVATVRPDEPSSRFFHAS